MTSDAQLCSSVQTMTS